MGWRDDSLGDYDLDIRRDEREPPRPAGVVLGVTSVALGLFSGLLIVAAIGLVAFMPRPQIGQAAAPRDVLGTVVLVVAGILPISTLAGLVLGIIGASIGSGAGRTYSFVGITLNAVILIGMAVMVCLGITIIGLAFLACLGFLGLAAQQQPPAGRRRF